MRPTLRGETARWFAALAAVPFVMVLGNSMLIPVLPTIKARLDLTPVETGLIITAFSLPAGLTIPVAGALSDHLGRKAVMVPALAIYGAGGILAGLAAWLMPGQFGPILVARAIQGIGAGGTYQLAMALAGDVFQSRERSRALGLLEASNGLGKVVSPLLGSLAAMIVWFLPFFVYGFIALPTAAGVFSLVEEPPRKPPPGGLQAYGARIGAVARHRGAMLAVTYAAGLFSLFALFGVLSYLSDRLEQAWGMSELARGGVIAIPVTVMALAAYAGGVHLQRRPQHARTLAVGGLVLSGAALIVMAFLDRQLAALVTSASALGLGVGGVLPSINTAITSASSRPQRGVVTSLYGSVRFGGVAAGPPLFGLAAGEAARLAIFGGSAAVAALVAWGLARATLALPAGGQAGGYQNGGQQPARGHQPA